MKATSSSLTLLLRQHKILVQAGTLIAITLLMLIMAILPLYFKVRTTQSQLIIKEKEAVELSEQVQVLSNFDPEILAERMKILEKILPSRKDIVLYLVSIEGLSRELSLSLNGIQLQPGELSSASAVTKSKEVAVGQIVGMHSLDTELKITGAQENIYSFLRAVEQTAPLMKVKDIKVSRQGEDQFTLKVSLSMFYADPIPPTGLKGRIQLFTNEEEQLMQTLSELRTYADESAGETVIVGKKDLFTE